MDYTEETRQEKREQRKRRQRQRMPKHARSLGQLYLRAVTTKLLKLDKERR